MINYLVLGLIYDFKKESNYNIENKGLLQSATNTFQYNLLEGLSNLDNINIYMLNFLPFGSFPKYNNRLFFRTEKWKLFNKIEVNNIGTINLPFLKQWQREKKLYKLVNKWIKSTKGEKKILVYSIYLPFEKVIHKIRTKYNDIISAIIVPDLPGKYGLISNSIVKKTIELIYGHIMLKYISCFEKFILLTEQMADPLLLTSNQFIVIEGFVNKNVPQKINWDANKKIIFYAGSLKEEYGIKNLVDSFLLINNSNYELWICGDGETKTYIIESSKKDKRIKYYGFLEKDKVLELQSKASLLVNPRKDDSNYTKYSFPSKTMEYLASGVPILMFKLSGIPSEYYEFINFFDSDSIEEMKEKICLVLERNQLININMCKKARKFVMENKSNVCQANRIYSFINDEKDYE